MLRGLHCRPFSPPHTHEHGTMSSRPFQPSRDNSRDNNVVHTDHESFPDYLISTTETESVFYFFVLAYVLLSFLLIAPLVIWGRKHERERAAAVARAGFYNQQQEFSEHGRGTVHPAPPQAPIAPLQAQQHAADQGPFRDPRIQQPVYQPAYQNVPHPGLLRAPLPSVFRGIDRVATTAYPDDDPDFMSVVSGSQQGRHQRHRTSVRSSRSRPTSNVPSAATTSRLYQNNNTRVTPKTQIWDTHARRWKARRPIGRPDVIYQAYRDEMSSMGGSMSERQSLYGSRHDGSRHGSRGSRHGGGSRAALSRAALSRQPSVAQHQQHHHQHTNHMSDVASSILTDDLEGPPLAQQRVIINYHRRHGGESIASSDRTSFFQRDVIDDISPNDAADAGDPGRRNSLANVESVQVSVCCGARAMWRPQTIAAGMDALVELAEPDLELQRIVKIGIPLTLGAMAKSLFHLITIAFVANFISTDAMVAYVIVHLLLGLTNELIGAVADAQSTLCSHALSMGNWLLAGQYAQLAILIVLLVNVPLLLMWSWVMDDLVQWLVQSSEIAQLAEEYTKVILIYQVLDGVSRSLTVLFHLTGNEKFETRFSIGEGMVALIGVTCVSALAEEADLRAVGGIQLIIGCAAFLAKVAYALLRGWLRIFYKGMFRTVAVANCSALCTLIFTTIPLAVGAFLEYGEWDIILFFVVSMGPAEVATWAIVGVIWQLLESATEGFGEAAAIRVAFHLGSGNPKLARHASHKALLVSSVQALLVTSILLMAGKNIANVLTPDPTLQLLLNNLITNVALGNLVMSTAMNVWSLLGAQGRYRLATLVILLARWLVTMPVALVCIYGFRFDLNSVMGAVTLGFATSVLILSYIFFRSDWDRLSRIMQELNAMMEVDSDFGDSSSEEEDEDDVEDHSDFDPLEESNLTNADQAEEQASVPVVAADAPSVATSSPPAATEMTRTGVASAHDDDDDDDESGVFA